MMMHWQQHNTLRIPSNEIHIWLINIDSYISCLPQLFQLLILQEQQRANRFRFEKDRNRFIITHGVLRLLLNQYLRCGLHAIHFESNEYGKPILMMKDQVSDFTFNLSHSKNRALIAMTQESSIGVDIESVDQNDALSQLVDRFFSQHEKDEYHRLSKDQQLVGFYNGWTRKEAFTKALGHGIRYPLKQFSVNLTPGEEAQLIWIADQQIDIDEWHLKSFMPAIDYSAAVAWQGLPKEIRFCADDDGLAELFL